MEEAGQYFSRFLHFICDLSVSICEMVQPCQVTLRASAWTMVSPIMAFWHKSIWHFTESEIPDPVQSFQTSDKICEIKE